MSDFDIFLNTEFIRSWAVLLWWWGAAVIEVCFFGVFAISAVWGVLSILKSMCVSLFGRKAKRY